MIDIIIPAYNAHNTITRTLFSICSQQIDCKLNVYICNDASKNDYSDIVNDFKNYINIKEIKLKKNSGPGEARQIGIDKSKSDYIVFIDSDDVFYTPIALKSMYEKIKENDSDVLVCSFLEQTNDDYVLHTEDYTWLHGKMYKRSFIKDKGVKFNETYSNEDTYFNKSLFIRKPKIDYLDDIVYLWLYNEDSITRKNNREYDFKGLLGYIDNITEVIEEARKDKLSKEDIAEYTFSFLYAVYFNYLNFYDDKSVNLFIEKSRKLRQYYLEYEKDYKVLKEEMFVSQYEFFKNTIDYMKVINPVITFDEFLKLYDK